MRAGSIYRSDAARIAVEQLYDRARARLPFPTDSRMVPTTFGDDPRARRRTERRPAARRAPGRQCCEPADTGVARPARRDLPHLRPGHDRSTGQDAGATRVGERLEPRRLDGRRARRARASVRGVHRGLVRRRRLPPPGDRGAEPDRPGGAGRSCRDDGGTDSIDAVAGRGLPVLSRGAAARDRRSHRPTAGRPGIPTR